MILPVLEDEIVRLRPITRDDAAAMFATQHDPEIARLTGTHGRFKLKQALRHCEGASTATNRVDYAITRPSDPAYLGDVVLNDIDRDNRSANFRIALVHSEDFGRGLGTAAMRLLIGFGFRQLRLHRIELEVYEFNARARHVYSKLGFVEEGIRRDALLWDGRFHSAIVMSLLESEFERADGYR